MLSRIFLVMSVVASVAPNEVCYPRLGCFRDDPPFGETPQRPISHLPWSPEKINTRFLLYTRDNPNSYREISAVTSKSIKESNFRKSQKTRFIIHGFVDSGEKRWLTNMAQAMLQVEDVNCICVDWFGGSLALYSQASNNLRVVGAEVAYFIKTLKDIYGYSPSNVHIIGHSLGAHAAGEAGKRSPGIGRISGLDPAQPFFQDTPPEVRLDQSDAILVDVIHTDATPLVLKLGLGGYGMTQTVGHLDFFPNGGQQMPGCSHTHVPKSLSVDDIVDVTGDLVACNHLRSYKYYTESILSPDGFIGYAAPSYDAFQVGSGLPCSSKGCPMMGHYASNYSEVTSTTQIFYLNTGDKEMFSRWRYEITLRIVGSSNALASFAVSLEGSNGKTEAYNIYSGLTRSDTTYTKFIDAEIYVGRISRVTFIWHSNLLGIGRFGASFVKVLSWKNREMFSFCGNGTMRPGDPQILSPC